MALRKFKPTSAGVRHAVLIDRSELSKVRPFRGLTTDLRSQGLWVRMLCKA